jgi:hypothetical protein
LIRDELVKIFADPRYKRDENLVRLLREEEWWTKEGSKKLYKEQGDLMNARIPEDYRLALMEFAETHAPLVLPSESTVVEITLGNGEKKSFPLGRRMSRVKTLARGKGVAKGKPTVQDRNRKLAALIRDELVKNFKRFGGEQDNRLGRLKEDWWNSRDGDMGVEIEEGVRIPYLIQQAIFAFAASQDENHKRLAFPNERGIVINLTIGESSEPVSLGSWFVKHIKKVQNQSEGIAESIEILKAVRKLLITKYTELGEEERAKSLPRYLWFEPGVCGGLYNGEWYSDR